jgi:heme/copper-type cytochrome/quinol oxidase subunit 1
MHSLVRRYIRTGIVFLALGVAAGAWVLVARELGRIPAHPSLVSAHAHAVLAGFVLFLILGVALWLFPRPPKGDTRYRPGRVEGAYWMLTLGTALRVLAEAARALSYAEWQRWAIVAGAAGQVAGLALYFWTMWPRIRGVGSPVREARGERF